MRKITFDLPDDLKAAVEREAGRLGISQAEVIRRAIAANVERPKPRGGIITAAEPIADRVDELLVGFGER